MKRLAAVLWLDWRLARRDLAVLAAFHLAAPPFAALFGPPETPSLMVELFGLPIVAALLAATISAGDSSLPFLRARPLAWWAILLARLGLRGLLLGALILLGRALVARLAPGSEIPTSGASVAPLLGIFACSAAASSFTRQPLAALITGLAAFLAGAFGLGPLLGLGPWRASALVAALMVPLALLLLWARIGPSPLPPARTLLRLVAPAAVLALLALLPFELYFGARIRAAEEAWDWLPPAMPALLAPTEAAAALARLSEAGIACGPAMGDSWLPRRSQCAWLRTASNALRARANQDFGIEPRYLPVAAQAAVLEPARPELWHAIGVLSGAPIEHEAELLGGDGREDLRLVLVSEALVAHAAGERERAEGALALLGRLLLGTDGQARALPFGDRSDAARVLVSMIRLGLPVPRQVEDSLDRLDLRWALARDAREGRADWLQAIRPGLFGGGLFRRGAIGPAALLREAKEHEELGRLLGEWSRAGTCFEHWPTQRLSTRWQSAERFTLEAQLMARVLVRRAGREVPPDSHCAGTRWIELDHPDGSWSILLDGGPDALRHDEPAGGPDELWKQRQVFSSGRWQPAGEGEP